MKEDEEHKPHLYCESCAKRVAKSTWLQNHRKCWACNHLKKNKGEK